MIPRLARGRPAADRRGVALVEFALVLPVMLILYLGSVQLQDGMACSRKVTITTRAIADLAAQSATGTTTKAEVDSMLAAATQVMLPYSASAASIRVSELAIDPTLKTTVQWSRVRNSTAYPPGLSIAVPAELRIPGTSILFAEVTYTYRPPVSFFSIGALTLKDRLYMLPRNAPKIDCADC